MRIALLAFALLLSLADPVQAAWRRPVPGGVARAFAYSPSTPFRAGAHRGVDLVARAGARVRAACSGQVVTAAMGVVTLRCGPWRVTALPVTSSPVRVGARIHAGASLGQVGAMTAHTGLHLGVRRAGDRFAYVDPLPLLADTPRPPVTVGPPPASRPPAPAGPRVAAPPPRAAPAPRVAAPRARPAPRVSAPRTPARSGGVRVPSPAGAGGVAPWPAWAGLGLLAVGAVGGGVRVRVRRARARAGAAVPSAP